MADEKRLIPESERDNLIRCLKKIHDCDFTPGVYEHSVIGRAALFLEETADAIVPPVKIGQILWCNLPHSEFPLECRVYCICREERNGLVLDYFRCVVNGWFGKAFCFEDVGKTIFHTEAEALANMDGGDEK